MSITTRRLTTNAALIPADTGDWRDNAECRRHDPDLWFPVGHSAGWTAQIREAKKICGRCPVADRCLEWAVETGQPNGIWGGLTEGERLELLRGREGVRVRAYELCIQAQEYIESRVAQGASAQKIGAELGVGHSSVLRACRFFEQERAAAAAAGPSEDVVQEQEVAA